MASIFDEYRRFSGTSLRVADQEFIEMFREKVQYDRGLFAFIVEHCPQYLLHNNDIL
jgi:hypothetical protein